MYPFEAALVEDCGTFQAEAPTPTPNPSRQDPNARLLPPYHPSPPPPYTIPPSVRFAYRSKLLLLRIVASSMSKPVHDITVTTAQTHHIQQQFQPPPSPPPNSHPNPSLNPIILLPYPNPPPLLEG